MPALDETAVPAFPAHVKMRYDEARKRWVLLAPERVLMPDEIAVEILKRVDGRAVAAIIDDLAAAFEAPREDIARDVIAMLQDLADKGVIRI